MLDKWFKKEKPVFTGITRGLGGFGFGGGGGAAEIPSTPITASGGTKITSGSDIYHVFISDQNFEITSGNNTVELILVGGGGGSAGSYAGGGGAGGVAHATAWPMGPGTYPVVIGDGGTGGSSLPAAPGALGGNSTFNGITSLGGGVGMHDGFQSPGPWTAKMDGGSGGGNGDDPTADSGDALQPAQPTFGGLVSNYGFPGFGPPSNDAPGSGTRGGGGGGSGEGGPVTTDRVKGGDARAFPSFPAPVLAPGIPSPAQPTWTPTVGPIGYFGGGGSGNRGPGSTGPAPTGGGGIQFTPGTAFTGGGSGGTHPSSVTATNGAKGIFIIKYAAP